MFVFSWQVISHSPADTVFIGKQLGELARAGDIYCVTGDLGAGKTQLAKGLGLGLGVAEPVVSPTFTLVRQYQGRLPFYHFDVYRLTDPAELLAIGYEDYFFDEGVTLVEWAEKIEELLPPEVLWIELLGSEDAHRRITFTAPDERYRKLLAEVKNRCTFLD